MTEEAENTPVAQAKTKPKRFVVRNYIEPSKLKADASFNANTLSDAMMQQASLLVHYGILFAQAQKQTNDLELLLEATEAAVYRRERDDAIDRGEKPSDAGLKQIVSRNSQVNSVKKALNEARQVEATAKIAVEAIRQKKDMLVSQGLITREEMKGEVSIRERDMRDAFAEDQRNRVLEARKNLSTN